MLYFLDHPVANGAADGLVQLLRDALEAGEEEDDGDREPDPSVVGQLAADLAVLQNPDNIALVLKGGEIVVNRLRRSRTAG